MIRVTTRGEPPPRTTTTTTSTLDYATAAEAGSVNIEPQPDGGVAIRIVRPNQRAWPLAIGFAVIAILSLIAVAGSGSVSDRVLTLRTAILAGFSVVFALMAVLAAWRGESPPTDLHVDRGGFSMSGGLMGASGDWRSHEIIDITADVDSDRSPGADPQVCIDLRHGQRVFIPMPNADAQAKVVSALREALNMPDVDAS
jgi:hypothetical protein